jgi:hypothetical protein
MLYKLSLTSRDKSDIQNALDGVKYLSCLQDIVHAFRDKSKYSGNPETHWGVAYDLLWQVLREHEIDPLSEE